MKRKVIILGAGIQGCCITLELANRGYSVDLLDQYDVPFNRASVRYEGKIHLGLVYMNDPGFATPTLMLKGALQFSHNLSRWIGDSVSDLNISTSFYYLVSKDSFLKPDQLEERYDRLQRIYHQQLEESPGYHYLGTVPDDLIDKSSEEELSHYFNIDELQGGFISRELAIDTFKLAKHMKSAIKQNPNITFHSGHKVKAVSQNGGGYVVEGINSKGSWEMKSLQVVNATWSGRFTIDQTMGIPPPEEILYRLKYRVIAEIPKEMRNYPSATMVIGRFGDVVIRSDATAYISWYPDSCRGWASGIHPPEEWDEICRGEIYREDFEEVSGLLINSTEKWYPKISNCKPKIVDAGTIVALGKTDVDDEDSQLHKRSNVGVTSYDGYHTVETGKLTTAPMFAMDTAENVEKVFQLF